ncbi:MAG TPA: pilus assembly protein TadG-related protein [Ilumatobacteraceae bacterium]|nr:pilus assembly protein TadG-related protein [Ilumatobacteraceae bacterium]
MRRRTERATIDGGQAVVLLLVVVVMVALSVVAIGEFGGRIVARGHAQTAADAAALAAAVGGRSAAERLAAANGATLVSFADSGDGVTVVVEFDGMRATAQATDGP